MPTNQYIQQPTNYASSREQNLVNDLIEEAIKFYGTNVKWLPRKLVAEDAIYGEDVLSKFDQSWEFEMYVKNVEGFEGEGDFLSRFGLEIRDQMTLTLSIQRFDRSTAATIYDRPREGDLIWFPLARKLTGHLFEIKFVEHESMFLPLGTLPVYDLRCESFTYNSEEFDNALETGGPDALDNLEASHSYATDETTGGNPPRQISQTKLAMIMLI